ncbi:MAG: multidrug transporter [Desulfovibrionaceae bacterium CG1_02_65_16]|nr:MAG: multidrug transporter [Desulfovibrionaceae bacterium CG1_02_65_16]
MRHTTIALKTACLAALVPALLGGCTLAPKYERPTPPLATDWTTDGAAQTQPGAKAQDWREVITDAPTKHLVALALANNRDLRVALLNVEKAQATHAIKRADLFPHIDATAGGNMERTPATLSSSGNPVTSHAYSVGLGFSAFELDLFGRLQSLKEQALEQYLSTEATAKSVELTLVAQVASSYMTLAADREHLTTAQEILDTEQASYELVKQRFDNGIANELDLSQAQTTVDTARLSVASYTSQVTQDENALAVLIGMPVTPEMTPAQKLADITPLAAVPAGLPSEVLARRPDIVSAEHDLKAANAYVGAARAMFFPSISLTGSYGTASNEINGLFKSGSQQWAFVPQLNLPIFRAGSIIAAVRYSKADREASVAQYEKAVQTAFREVSDTLAQGASLTKQVEAQASLTKATGKSYELATLRYENGVDSYLTKLDSQRSNATARQNLITARLSQQTNRLTLFKALGGGWNGKDEPEAAKLLRNAREAKDSGKPLAESATPAK